MPCLPLTCHRAPPPAKKQQSPSDTAGQEGCSPRERRWSDLRERRGVPQGVLSARAEVVRVSRWGRSRTPSALRASGGGPCCQVSSGGMDSCSPRERRWSDPEMVLTRAAVVLSARAEVVRPRAASHRCSGGALRASGGGPRTATHRPALRRCSPRERRWSASRCPTALPPGVLSARAEVVRRSAPGAWWPSSALRASGGGPPESEISIALATCSPRERRWSRLGLGLGGQLGVLSARAEVVRTMTLPRPSDTGALRASGGGPQVAA